MMSALYKKLKEKLNDNRGSALVLVIIAIAFVGTLVAMLVYLVYFNYLMKFTDRSAKSNFYTAESALEVIKAGLEKDVSEAMVVSYYNVMSNNTSDSALNKQAAFEEAFRDQLESVDGLHIRDYTLGSPAQTMNYYDPSILEGYWAEVQKTNSGYEGFKVASAEGAEGAWLETYAWDRTNKIVDSSVATDPNTFREKGPVVIYNGSVMEFKNVRVKYIDEKGYVSIIETDIQIETPKINFSNVLSVPRLEEYSLIAAGGIYNGYERQQDTATSKYVPKPVSIGADTIVTGNVNGGEDGIYVHGVDNLITFEKKAGDPDSKVYTITADMISASSGRRQSDVSNERPASVPSVDVADCYEIWANDLYTESATLNIDANCFIQDDLTTDGSYPAVYLGGTSYSGYGTADTTAKGNSAILINGAHTTLDMSGLQKLELAGHAYVGTIHYYAELDNPTTGDYISDVDEFWKEQEKKKENSEGSTGSEEDSSSTTHADGTLLTDPNEKEVLMGQSVAVKADQLMYMVPVECMGYDGDTQILAKNPMTYNEYLKFATTYEPEYDEDGNVVTDPQTNEIVYSDKLKYDVVRLDVVMNKVGGSINSYGADYVPVFRRVNGDILVYFYIKFTTDDRANEFFLDYYKNDPDAFADYFESYVDTYRINSSITANGSDMLHIAGNMLYMRNGRIYLKEDTYEEDLNIYDSLYNTRQQNALYFQNLTKYLMKSTDDLAAAKLQNDVFTNIAVDETTFAEQVAEGKFSKYKNAEGKVVALVINNAKAGVFEFSSSNSALGMSSDELKDVHLIIATGDVKVDVREYDGLIFVGGDIYIGQSNESIDYDYAQVPLAMTAISDDGQYVFEVIQNGIAYANTIGTTDDELRAAIEAQSENDIVRASELVRFVNWNKE